MDINQKYRFPFASYPAVRLVLLIVAGILVDYHFTIPSTVWVGIFSCFALLYWGFELLHNYYFRPSLSRSAIACYLILILAFGGLWHSFYDYRESPTEATVLNSYTWQELTFSGTVGQIKETSTGKYQIDVTVDSTVFPDNILWTNSYQLRAVLNTQDLPLPDNLTLADRIIFRATVYPLEEPRNPSQFDYKNYLASIGIYTQVGIRQISSINHQQKPYLSWNFYRQHVLDAINNNFSIQIAPLAKALLIGHKNELGREDKIAFSRAGLSHIMAVSGLHVGFILAPFWILIPLFWTFRYGKQLGLALLIGFLLFYAGLTGFSASVTRASLVGGLLAYGKLFHKVRDSKNLTAVAALIILIINPGELFTIGFQLSFAAVYAILLTAPVISRQLPAWIQYRWYGQPLMVVVISFIVQLGLFPLLAYHFGEFSVVGPLANAFVVPILGLAVPLALILLPFGMVFPSIAQTLNIPIEYFLQALDWFVDMAANWPWSWMQVHIESLLFFAIWTTAIFLIAALPIPKMRWKVLAVLLMLLCVNQGKKIIHKLQPAQLEVTVFDVGQGDAALISTPNDKHFLVDAGRWQPDYNSAKYVIIPHLKEEGINKLNAVFLSHPHADHIGGMIELINTVPIDTIYNSGAEYDSKLFQNYQQTAIANRVPVKSLTAGDQVAVDPAIRIFVYGPDDQNRSSNVNNHSLILEVIYGETEFLFTGDSERSQEQQLISNYPSLTDTDFLKVPHHGSKTSSTTPLLQSTTAQMGVVSLGKSNQFRHPHPAAVERLRNHIQNLQFTSLQGAIHYYSDGYQIYQKK